MRGNPAGQLVLIFLAFLALGVPVWRLTRPAAPVVAASTDGAVTVAPAATSPAVVKLEATADFAPVAAEFSLSYLDQTILMGKAQTTTSGAWEAAIPPEGADLVLHVVWAATPGAASARTAARVTLRFPDGQAVEKTFWSTDGETLDAVVTVPGGGR